VDRAQCYVTNAVKHFKWEPRGKRRLHQKPNSLEIAACRPWWQAELALIKPQFLVCLGSTAARAVFGREVKVMREAWEAGRDAMGGAHADYDPSFRAASSAGCRCERTRVCAFRSGTCCAGG
jgi:uracil-DNA glycosylase